MEFDLMTGAGTWAETAEFARSLEANGFSGMLFTETSEVPWMKIAAAATAAPDLHFCTGWSSRRTRGAQSTQVDAASSVNQDSLIHFRF